MPVQLDHKSILHEIYVYSIYIIYIPGVDRDIAPRVSLIIIYINQFYIILAT